MPAVLERVIRKQAVIVSTNSETTKFGFFRLKGGGTSPMRRIVILCALFIFWGCDTRIELAQNVSQRQSLSIVSVLSKAGIEASAVSGKGAGGRFSIYVDKKNYARATSVLVENGLPAEEEESIGAMLEGSSFLPQSRLMEGLKADRALALQIEQHLEVLPNVTGAKVLLRTVPNGAISERGVSVLLFVVKDSVSKFDKQFIEQHVETLFPDLRLDRFKVSIVEDPQSRKPTDVSTEAFPSTVIGSSVPVKDVTPQAESGRVPFLWLWTVNESQYTHAAALVLFFFLISGVVGAAVGIWWMSYLGAQIRTEQPKLPGLPARKAEPPARGGARGAIPDDKSVTGTRRISGGVTK
jgi:type III secretory pathway lipoprotein EscJ